MPPAKESESKARTRILVVDDEPALCELVEAVLLGAGMEASSVSSSQQAIERLMKEKYDAVFLDVWMPAPDGFEVAQRMRSAGFNQKTPLVMITGDADPGVLKRGFESGANYFLFKPIDRRGLLRLVRATQGSIQNEKRRFQRVGVRCKVTVSSGSERVDGHTLDVSLNGVLVEASRAFDQNAGVDVEIKLPAGAPVRARGRVMRKIDNRMGILLDNMQSNESARLQEFLLPLILSAIEQEATSAGN